MFQFIGRSGTGGLFYRAREGDVARGSRVLHLGLGGGGIPKRRGSRLRMYRLAGKHPGPHAYEETRSSEITGGARPWILALLRDVWDASESP
jgi:hypothetical protein